MQRQERRRANATRTRLTLENVQVSLTMMNYAKASYGCVFRKLWGAKTSRSARITRVSSCLQAHPKVTSYDDGHGTISWILVFAVVKDPALVVSPRQTVPCCSLSSVYRERRIFHIAISLFLQPLTINRDTLIKNILYNACVQLHKYSLTLLSFV